ncbi:Z1 domain-containing protein [Cellulomonas endophytica]|uniref:Z1 domain-containing protein n=1 Tax=Cellulomonas endophytica TaxID=2494735 RepID=UPI0013E9799C|nr:Z1 domain-containing protein [Cellulomonas endophytica]
MTGDRDAQIVAMRASGSTLQEIGDGFGLTREAVRQILTKRGGVSSSEARQARAAEAQRRDARAVRDLRADVLAHPGTTVEEVADRVALPVDEVRRLLPDDVRRLLVRPQPWVSPRWSHDQTMQALVDAATFEWPLSSTAYDDLLRVGEVQGPSAVRIGQVYGSFSAACEAAGVEPVRAPRDDYQSRWTDTELLDWVADYLRAPGSSGSFSGYEAWRAVHGSDAPSGGTLRNRYGAWSAVKQTTFLYMRETGQSVAELGAEAVRVDQALASKIDDATRTSIWESAREVLEAGPLAAGTPGSTCLALGLVQSGKTTSIIALLAAAADAGYRIAIAVLGSTNLLLDQNRGRVEEALGIGRRQDYVWVSEPNLSGPAGAKRLATHLDRGRVVIVPVLKHAGRIAALADALKSLALDVPTIVVDDEADQASLNTLGSAAESRTYESIKSLREAVPNHLYVQYTATPYGPLMLDSADLLHPDKVVFLQPGPGYTGGREFFVDHADRVVRDVPVLEEQATKSPPLALPKSLEKAFACFLVGVATLMENGAADAPFSMLVHSTARNDVQQRYHFLLQRQLKAWRADVEQATSFADVPDVFSDERQRLVGSGAEAVDDDALLVRLRVAVRECNLWLVNSASDLTKVDWTVSPVHVLVGGNKLDRGFTVEGLTVTYMNRPASVQVDTLEQRARAFGYRSKLLPYCQFFASRRTVRSFRDIVYTEYDLRAQLQDHVDAGGSVHTWAQDVGLLLPEGMKPTRDAVVTALSTQPAGWHSLRRPSFDEVDKKNNEARVRATGLLDAPLVPYGRLAFRTVEVPLEELLSGLLKPWVVESYSPGWRRDDLVQHLERNVPARTLVPVLLMDEKGDPRARRWDEQVGFVNLFQGKDPRPQVGTPSYAGDRATPGIELDPDRVAVQVHHVYRRGEAPSHSLLTLALHLGTRTITRKMSDD